MPQQITSVTCVTLAEINSWFAQWWAMQREKDGCWLNSVYSDIETHWQEFLSDRIPRPMPQFWKRQTHFSIYSVKQPLEHTSPFDAQAGWGPVLLAHGSRVPGPVCVAGPMKCKSVAFVRKHPCNSVGWGWGWQRFHLGSAAQCSRRVLFLLSTSLKGEVEMRLDWMRSGGWSLGDIPYSRTSHSQGMSPGYPRNTCRDSMRSKLLSQ